MELRVGLIGCGRISPMHIASIKRNENACLAAVCDVKRDRAEDTASRYGCKYYLDYKDMISGEELDVVHICTPHYLHHDMAVFAASNKVHVITEKPMAISYQDAEDMVKACRDNNVSLSVIFQNRYNRAVQFIRKELQQGNLGKPLSARVIVTWNRDDDYYLKSDWKGTWDKEGGGVVIDQAIHSLDIVRYVLGLNAVRVQANICNRRHRKVQIEDTAEGFVEFENNVFLSFFTMNYFTCDAPIDILFHFENASARITGDMGEILYNDGRQMVIKPLDDDIIDYGDNVKKYWGFCHYIEIGKIYNCIMENRQFETNGADGLMTQRIVNAIYESGKNGKAVEL